MVKTPGGGSFALLGSSGASFVTSKAAPRPGTPGSVGERVRDEDRTPLEVTVWAKRSPGVRLQKRPADRRRTVFGSGDQENPKLGDHLLVWSAIFPVRLNEPLGLTSLGFKIGVDGLSSLS